MSKPSFMLLGLGIAAIRGQQYFLNATSKSQNSTHYCTFERDLVSFAFLLKTNSQLINILQSTNTHSILFKNVLLNFSGLRSYNYPPNVRKLCKRAFLLSPQSVSPPHLQLKADKRVKRPWLRDVFSPHRTLRWFMLTASRFTLYLRHIAYKSLGEQNSSIHRCLCSAWN